MNNRKIQVHQLDPYSFPLHGCRLIEASAGTGKTYIIALLYLRLLLGNWQKNTFSPPLQVKDILVVTFTEAATNELRSRIRDNIHQMRIACIRNGIGFDESSRFRLLLSSISDKNRKKAAQWLLRAERQIDEAAIHTIHGICQRLLLHNAFESGMLFEQSIIKDEDILQQQACADFWRSNCYPIKDYSIAKVISEEWSDPEALLEEIKPYLQGDLPNFFNQKNKIQSIEDRHKELIDMIKIVKKLFLTHSKDCFYLISNSNVNKRIYSLRNLGIWLNAVINWAEEVTVDYKIPRELSRFSQSELVDKTLNGKVPEHKVFFAVDDLLQQSFTLRDIFISKAIVSVRQLISQEKKRRREVGFDDLLSYLDQVLQDKNGDQLVCKIRSRYPVIMIDEFQDTDSQQYRIFQRIYQKSDNCSLFFIGDPKQAIYSFRGADIFTYLKAKDQIKSYYTLDVNWRSSPSMIAAINELFGRVENPFVFEQISFNSIKSSPLNQDLVFIHKGKKISGLNFFYLENKEFVSILDYQKKMAHQCASKICEWLKGGEDGTSCLYRSGLKRPVTGDDIVVLVRSHYEAVMIGEALRKFNISSVFLSNKESVFSTDEARDLLCLLEAVLSPGKDTLIRSALSTRLTGLTAKDIEELNHDENRWEIKVEEFVNYLSIWQRNGIFPALRAIMSNYKIAENLLADNMSGKRRLMDLMHLGELLQEAELEINSQKSLLRWFSRKINTINPVLENQKVRLEADKNFIRINTIHKSKGLEFSIVWLPFACQFSQKKFSAFHDRESFQFFLDLQEKGDTARLSDEECLSEDLRLLYVALTRSKYHCSVGVAPLIKGFYRKGGDTNTDLHKTALGYLLQNGKSGNSDLLRESLNILKGENIDITPVNDIRLYSWKPKEDRPVKLESKRFNGHIQNDWKVTSYSELTSHDISSVPDKFAFINTKSEIPIQFLMPRIKDDEQNNIFQDQNQQEKSIHNFPKGNQAGIFLHSLLELLPFSQDLSESWLVENLKKARFSTDWKDILKVWLTDIFFTPFLGENFNLIKIKPEYRLKEMEFYLPIKKLLLPSDLDNLFSRYGSFSKFPPPLIFKPVRGILKGYIDLVFFWKERFYLLDYKTNWLGESGLAYTQEGIERMIIDHRYDLQYYLYTLALHRYLRSRLSDYNYEKNFGGVIYLFLRGIDINKSGQGIYHTIPDYELINNLDEMFNEKT